MADAAFKDLPLEVPDGALQLLQDLCAPLSPVVQQLHETIRSFADPAMVKQGDAWLSTNINVHAKRLPLMDPVAVVAIAFGYLGVLFVLNIIVRLFPSPKDTALMKLCQIFHNLFLTLLSLYMFVEIIRQALRNKYSVWFNNLDNSSEGWPMAKILWVFYVSKIYEFLDTVIMLFRHSFRQVTFLHVYHHCSIFPIWWLVIFLGPTGDSYFSAALNSFVHVVMYSYYLMATFNISVPWKYYITKFQMLQFFANFCQAAALCYVAMPGYPQLLAQVLLIYMITLLALFYNFLVTSRRKSSSTAPHKKQQ